MGSAPMSKLNKIVAPAMTYIKGEEMTHYACNLILKEWIDPYFNTSKWEVFDLSCVARDKSDDKVLKDAVDRYVRSSVPFLPTLPFF